jgi:hypothetical protein
MGLALLRNYDAFQAPTHFRLTDLLQKFDKTFGASGRDYGKVSGDRTRDDIEKRRRDRWNFLFIAGSGSRTCSTTICGAPSNASFRTRHRRARSPSALTTPASGGGTSSRRCT